MNNEQVGRVVEFALDNPKKINFLSFQPVSFTGRDEEITPERRAAQRYTLSHLAHDVKKQTGLGEPIRDWFPISFMGTFTDWADMAKGPDQEWGNLTCGCHPNCGIGMAVMIDKETKEAVPVTAFLNAERLAGDVAAVTDAARGRFLTVAGMALALARNYDSFKSPTHFKLSDLLKKFDKTFGATKAAQKGKYGRVDGNRSKDDIEKRRADRWNFLFIAGMWFQDLFNYDFRRTEMCIIPYATQMGEISFCAYNTGIGWRNIIEKMHMTATLTKWYEEHGRHEIFAGNKTVPLTSTEHTLTLNARGRGRGHPARPRRPGHRQERPRREAGRAQEEGPDARRAAPPRGDGAALPQGSAQGAARRGRPPDPGPQEGADTDDGQLGSTRGFHTRVPHGGSSRGFLTGVPHGGSSRRFLTKVPHGGSSRRFLTEVPHGGASRGPHGGSSRRFLTEVPHGGSSRRFLTEVPHGGSTRRVRETGSTPRTFGTPSCGTLGGTPRVAPSCGTLVWHPSCGTPVWHPRVAPRVEPSCGTPVWNPRVEPPCGTPV